MDIPNLSQPSTIPKIRPPQLISPLLLLVFLAIGLASGFWLTRFNVNSSSPSAGDTRPEVLLSADKISSSDQLQVGKTYGLSSKTFNDSAIGSLEKGNINGEGTHILVREGGLSQRASLTSSALDLDLFVGHKVEVKGETNNSKKTAWLMDVGSLKVLE